MTIRARLSRCACALLDLRLRPYARSAATTGAAIAIVLASLTAFDVPECLAQGDFFQQLFGFGGPSRLVEPQRYSPERREWRSRRYAHRHGGRRQAHRFERSQIAHRHNQNWAHGEPRSGPDGGSAAPVEDAPGRKSVCVRTCDGHAFPVANISHKFEIASRQASCAALCPETEVKLFIMPEGSDDINEATEARRGETYAALLAKVKSVTERASCGCHAGAADPIESGALLNDPTLQAGDSVVTAKGVRVFKGGGALPHKSSDFLSLAEIRNLPIPKRGALAAIDRMVKIPHDSATLFANRRSEPRSSP